MIVTKQQSRKNPEQIEDFPSSTNPGKNSTQVEACQKNAGSHNDIDSVECPIKKGGESHTKEDDTDKGLFKNDGESVTYESDSDSDITVVSSDNTDQSNSHQDHTDAQSGTVKVPVNTPEGIHDEHDPVSCKDSVQGTSDEDYIKKQGQCKRIHNESTCTSDEDINKNGRSQQRKRKVCTKGKRRQGGKGTGTSTSDSDEDVNKDGGSQQPMKKMRTTGKQRKGGKGGKGTGEPSRYSTRSTAIVPELSKSLCHGDFLF